MKRFYLFRLMILIAILLGWNLNASAQTTTFNWNGTGLGTGSVQTYTVPLGVTSLGIDAKGAAGGIAYIESGCPSLPVSLGGRVQCVLSVTGGEVLYLYVGGAGQNDAGFSLITGGWNGGVNGTYFGAASGGATDIRLSNVPVGTYSSTTGTPGYRVVVAGGGGAGGDYSMAGGLGGGLTGGVGSSTGCGFPSGVGGAGGGQLGPGVGGGAAGTLGVGGGGGSTYGPGGGGYYGGNSGSSEAGGGGGSSFTDPSLCTSVVHTQGYSGANGNGQIIITVLCNGAGSITGALSVCNGSTTSLTAVAAPGGTWTSGNPSVATVGSTGIVSGIGVGTSVITYSVPNPCGGTTPATAVVTVNLTPSSILGNSAVCTFATTTLSSTPSGVGTWTSSSTGNATVDPSSGTVTGVFPGTTNITYTLPGGCNTSLPMTINSGPAALTGTMVVCAGGATTTLGETSTGGTWSSSATIVATVSSGGVVTGVTQGNALISYTFSSTGCVSSANVVVNPLPSPFIVTGGGAFCSGNSSTSHIILGGSVVGVSYQLFIGGTTSVGPAIEGTGLPIDYGVMSSPGVYTVVATNDVTHCSRNMTGSATISVTPLPALFNITSSANSYCADGSGVVLGLGGSVFGVSYKLFNGGPLPILTIGGTGGPLTFGTQPAGAYTVIASDATSNHCSSTMTGSPINIISNPLPTINNVTVQFGGAYCAGSGGVHIGLDFSNSGIEYSLFNGATFVDSVAGSNSGLDFGLQAAAGMYTVVATNSGSRCMSNMAGSATVTVNNPPTPVALTGGGNFCPGTTGVPIGVSGSDAGAQYQLYNGSTAIGSAVTGTGTGFDFGTFTTSGNYTVTAIDPSTGCKDTMPGSETITPSTLPTNYSVLGGGGYCAGGIGRDISLSGGDAGVTYYLYNGLTLVSTVNGTGIPVDFGNFGVSGTYTAVANNGSCPANMSGSAAITINPLPNVYSVTGGGGYCNGTAGRHIGLLFSDLGVSYQLYNGGFATGSPIPGSGAGLDFGVLGAGFYTVTAINSSTGCGDNMSGGATVVINPLPGIYSVNGGGDYCAGGSGKDISLAGSDALVNYQLYLGATAVGSPVPGGEEGGSIDFGMYTASGTYTVVGTGSTGCSSNMSGNAVITIDPLPHVYTLSGGGNYCTGGAGADIILSGSATGISYQLNVAGSPVGAGVDGTGSALDFGAQPASGAYTVVATDISSTCTNNMAGSPIINTLPLPGDHTVTGGGPYCAGGTGSTVGLDGSDAGIRYQLKLDGSAVGGLIPGSGAALNFGLRAATGSYTVTGIDPSSGCSADMSGTATVSTNPLPNVETVAGSGSYCLGTPGVDITLSPSDEGVMYYLYRGSVIVDSLAGGSGILDFGSQPAGTYTITGSDVVNRCSQTMSGTSVITVHTVTTYTLIGGGSYCQGGSGVHIGQSGSGSGVSYQLLLDGVNTGTPVTGTGSAIDFGLDTAAGSYTVLATDPVTTCTGTMAGTINVSINSLPAPHNVTGGGSLCAGGTGVSVSLDGSNEGVNYQLYNGSTAVGTAVSGTGISLNFGLVTGAGSYKAMATNPATGCTAPMSDSAVVVVHTLPAPYTISAENYGNYCAGDTGVHMMLAGSNAGVAYTLYNGDTLISTLTGTGSSIDFGLQLVAGRYTVTAHDPAFGCNNTMSGSANVYIIPLPIVHNVTGTGGYCPGGAGLDIGLDGSQAGVYYQLYNSGTPIGGTIYGTGVSLDFGTHPAGSYTIVGSSEVIAMGYVTTCPNPMFGNAVISVDTLLAPTVILQAYPGSGVGVWHIDSMKVFITNGGSDPTYQWVINGNIIPGATSATFTNHEFFNNDSVVCLVTANGPCGSLTTSKGITLQLHNVGVTQVTSAGSDIKLVPNPNRGLFTVRGTLGNTADEEVTLEVSNMLGQTVYSSKVTARGGNLDEHISLGGSLANGMYIMNIRSGSQNNVIHFVIEQ